MLEVFGFLFPGLLIVHCTKWETRICFYYLVLNVFQNLFAFRASYITHQSYHMDMGFSYSGFRSSVTARSYSKSPETVCALDWQQSYLACNWTNPADNVSANS